MNEVCKEVKHHALVRLQEIFPGVDIALWHVDIMRPDNIIQCERYSINSIYFNFLPDGKYEVEIFTPIDGGILSYKFDECSIAKMFYLSHCEHLQAIRKAIRGLI